jgi:hypothetical protein
VSDQAEVCRQKAQHCNRAASLAVTLEARLMYADLARLWRELGQKFENERRLTTVERQ